MSSGRTSQRLGNSNLTSCSILALLNLSAGSIIHAFHHHKHDIYEAGNIKLHPSVSIVRFKLSKVIRHARTPCHRAGKTIEINILFPWTVVYRYLGVFGFIEMFLFILILTYGLLYAWRRGALNWQFEEDSL